MRRVINLIVSVIMIFMGLSGKYVLIGTNSNVALVVVAIVFACYNLYQLLKENNKDLTGKK